MKDLRYLIILVVFQVLFSSCGDEKIPVPKPRAYPKVVYPEKSYQVFSEKYCPMSFEYPKYAKIIQDTLFFNEKPENPCWFNIFIPQFDCYLYCTYSDLRGKKGFDMVVNDAFTLAYKHDQRANFINDTKFTNENGLGGMQFEMTGPAATPFQFFITDSTTHFLRGALYFNTQVRPDSLLPVYKFVKQDMDTLIKKFKFK